jgi:hypothetical protein
MPDPNPNRELPADQVVHLFKKNLPSMLGGLGADRDWLWWSGPKPGDDERATLRLLGFQFTPRPHRLADGREAHWYHACGGAVKRPFKRKSGSTRQHRLDTKSGRDHTGSPDAGDDFSDLERIAAALP